KASAASESTERTEIEMLARLAHIVERRSRMPGDHNWRVARDAGDIACALGLGAEYAENLMRAARLHDVGKAVIPDRILLSQNPLDSADTEVVKSHPAAGAQMLAGGTSELMRLAESVALTHHERWDGTGYPQGL